jgi:hypothetical protein
MARQTYSLLVYIKIECSLSKGKFNFTGCVTFSDIWCHFRTYQSNVLALPRVGGIGWSTSKHELDRHFSRFG